MAIAAPISTKRPRRPSNHESGYRKILERRLLGADPQRSPHKLDSFLLIRKEHG